jgi:NAD(P)H-dependent FMN reductase
VSDADALRVLAFAGSTREGSLNRRLLRVAARGAEDAGADCALVELREQPLPLYDGDLERAHGLPAAARALKQRLAASSALLIASPEYNGSLSAVLKNTLDWLSRSAEGLGPDLSSFRGLVVGVMSASTGPLGGARGLAHLRAVLAALGCLVLPDEVSVRNASDAFDAAGEPVDPKLRERLERLGARVVEVARATRPRS